MEVKRPEKTGVYRYLRHSSKEHVKRRPHFIYFLALLVALLIVIFETRSSFYTYQLAKYLAVHGHEIVINYISSFSSTPKKIEINVKDSNWKKLTYIKEMSRNHYVGLDNQDTVSLMRREWVPAKLVYKGRSYRIDMRVKGQSTDHWGKYGSYKIKVKDGETLFGMKRFAIEHPKTRGYMNEWFFHQFLKFNDLISLRYDFVKVSINGDAQPIYALEENFGKRLIENNHRKEGLIFRINYLRNDRILLQQSDSEIQSEHMQAGIEILTQNVNSFFDGTLRVSNVFDIDSLARFYAVLDLWGNRHAGQLKNMRFYFNPSTSLIEPIGYDQQSIFPTQFLDLLGTRRYLGGRLSDGSHFFDLVFSDSEFFKKYIIELERIAQKDLLDEFFSMVSKEHVKKLRTLYKSYPYFEYKIKYPALLWFYQEGDHTRYSTSIWLPADSETLYQNQEYIESKLRLTPNSAVVVYDKYTDQDRLLRLKFFNNELMPLGIRGLTVGGTDVPISSNEKIIQFGDLNREERFGFLKVEIPKSFRLSSAIANKIVAKIGILGGSSYENYVAQSPPKVVDKNSLRQFDALDKFDFLIIDEDQRTISFEKGEHIVNTMLTIPPGYTATVEGGTKIKLVDNSSIISYSPVNILGTEESPIVISSDSTGGVTVINADGESIIQYVQFHNLSNIAERGLDISGAINFYESDVKISDCVFTNTKSEDSINIVRSRFVIEKCIFSKSLSDAIDIDFSNGELSNLRISDTGNDGIDVSGSKVDIVDVKINTVGDKGISVGENSTVDIDGIHIENAKIGISIKDKSYADIDKREKVSRNLTSSYDGIYIGHCDIGIAVYQKKPEYGPSEVHIGDRRSGDYVGLTIENTNTHFMVEKDSFFEIGQIELVGVKENVYESIYKQ